MNTKGSGENCFQLDCCKFTEWRELAKYAHGDQVTKDRQWNFKHSSQQTTGEEEGAA